MKWYYCPGARKIKGQRITIWERIRKRLVRRNEPTWVKGW